MSFFSCKGSSKIPGPICGNPLNGLCERVCLQANRVFDSGIIQRALEDEEIVISNLTPDNPVFPLTFVNGNTVISASVPVENVQINRVSDRPNFARVSGDAIVPLRIDYTDANGVPGYGFATLTIPFDVILFVPQDALVPIEIDATANVILPIGEYVSGTTFRCDGCINLIIRCVVKAQLLVPSYGYCLIPKATEYTEDLCRGFFDQPLYPVGGVNVTTNT